MTKWAFLTLTYSPIVISSTERINLAWLQNLYPKAKFTEEDTFNKLGCWRCQIEKLSSEDRPVFWAIIKYIGENGWEPVNRSDDASSAYHTFKRQLPD